MQGPSPSTFASSSPVPDAALPRWLPRVVLGAMVLFQLIPALAIVTTLPVYGDDHSSHMAAIRHLLQLLASGQTDLFCPTFNLGFPMYLYYQPLPHLAAALLNIVSVGTFGPQLAFNLTLVLLWSLYPIAIYRGLRTLELDPLAALLSAVCAPLVASTLTFGFTLHSVMALGLYTQTWAMVLLPLALGSGWRAIQPDASLRTLLIAGGWLLLLCLCHAFYGLVLGTALGVGVLMQPRRFVAGLARLLLLGLVTIASLSYWLVPLLRTRAFAGGWPWGGPDRWQGYGAAKVAKVFFSGQLFDEGQLPAISIGILAGLFFAAWRWRQPAARFLIATFALFVVFLMGRRTFGHLVDIQPANLGLQLFRYIGAVHLFGVALAGFGLARLARFVHRRLGKIPATALLVGLLISPLIGQQLRGHSLFRTIRSYDQVSAAELARFGTVLDAVAKKEPRLGRVYAHNKVGTGTHLMAALLAHYTELPLGQSYGVGMHDSLGFYYLEYLEPTDQALLGLYGFRFALAAKTSSFAKARQSAATKPLAESRHLALYRFPSEHGFFTVGRAGFALLGNPRELRSAIRSYLKARLFERGLYGLVVPPQGHAAAVGLPQLKLLTGTNAILRRQGSRWQQTRTMWKDLPVLAKTAPVGRVVKEGLSKAQGYQTEVELTQPGLVVLKIAYHPFWQVEVDGKRQTALQATPALLAVQVPAGKHRVVFRFVNPRYQKLLASGSALLWLLVLILLTVRRPEED